MKAIIDYEKLCEIFNLTPNQLMYCSYLYLASKTSKPEEQSELASKTLKYQNDRAVTKIDLETLQNKGYLLSLSDDGDKIILNESVILTSKFNSLFAEVLELEKLNSLGLDLFKTYPQVIRVNGEFYTAKALKSYNKTDLFKTYEESINHSKETHEKVKQAIKWYVDTHTYLDCGFANFVVNENYAKYLVLYEEANSKTKGFDKSFNNKINPEKNTNTDLGLDYFDENTY